MTPRRRLQQQAKAAGIPANLKTIELEQRLAAAGVSEDRNEAVTTSIRCSDGDDLDVPEPAVSSVSGSIVHVSLPSCGRLAVLDPARIGQPAPLPPLPPIPVGRRRFVHVH